MKIYIYIVAFVLMYDSVKAQDTFVLEITSIKPSHGIKKQYYIYFEELGKDSLNDLALNHIKLDERIFKINNLRFNDWRKESSFASCCEFGKTDNYKSLTARLRDNYRVLLDNTEEKFYKQSKKSKNKIYRARFDSWIIRIYNLKVKYCECINRFEPLNNLTNIIVMPIETTENCKSKLNRSFFKHQINDIMSHWYLKNSLYDHPTASPSDPTKLK